MGAKNSKGRTTLHKAVSREAHEDQIQENGINLNRQDSLGHTPLHQAIEKGNLQAAQHLISHGANCAIATIDQELPIHIAARKGYANLVKHFITECSVDVKARGGKSPLYIAAFEGRVEIVELLLSYGADVNIQTTNDETPLFKAVTEQNMTIVKMLKEHGADVNSQNDQGLTPLFMAAMKENNEIFTYLLKNGADPKHRSDDRRTLLHVAASHGLTNIAEALVAQGLDVNAESANGRSPIHEAAVRAHAETLKVLLQNGANVNKMVRLLSSHMKSQVQQHVLLHMNASQYSDSNNYQKISIGRSPLHCAAVSDSVECLNALIDYCADVNIFDNMGKSALYYSILNANPAAIHALLVANSPFMITNTDGNSAVSQMLADSLGLTPDDLMLRGRAMSLKALLRPDRKINILVMLLQHGMSPSGLIIEGRCFFCCCINHKIYPVRIFKALLHSGHPMASTLVLWKGSLQAIREQNRTRVYEYLSGVLSEPLPLLSQSCINIRQSLLYHTRNRSIWTAANKLPLPKILIDKVLLKNLQPPL